MRSKRIEEECVTARVSSACKIRTRMEVAAAGELAKQSAIALAAVVIELHEMSAKGAKIFKTK